MLTNSVETVVLSSSSSDQFILFPNPAESRESVTISTTRSIQSIELSDAQGKKMWEQTLNDDRKFTLPALESGMYFVKVITEQGSSVQKLIAK
ncbi:MAG TPA: T9SS type A sorting domain-containing protein [Cytophagaceae bacterium]|nr:T9SS type A sorting domain-containing protein [Cytophagaceae bacterium]